MNKQELLQTMVRRTTLNQKQCAEALDCILQTIAEQVAVGEKVRLVGFGNFERRYRSTKVGRNPKTKEPVQVPGAYTPPFKSGKRSRNW